MIHLTKKDRCWHMSVILNCQASLLKYKLAELTFRKCKTDYSWSWIRASADTSHLIADVRDNEFNLRMEGSVGGGLPACPAVISSNSLEGIVIVNWNSICLTVILALGLNFLLVVKDHEKDYTEREDENRVRLKPLNTTTKTQLSILLVKSRKYKCQNVFDIHDGFWHGNLEHRVDCKTLVYNLFHYYRGQIITDYPVRSK